MFKHEFYDRSIKVQILSYGDIRGHLNVTKHT